MKRFTSMEDVQAFAQSVKFNNPDSIRMPWMDKSKYVGLEVEGFSRIVPCFAVGQVWDHFRKEYLDEYYYDNSYWVLEIIPTGELFTFYEKMRNSKRFGLSMYERFHYDRCKYFSFDREIPNYVGKATEKKLQEWIDYLHEKREAMTRYVENAMALNRSKVEAFKAKYPDGYFNTLSDGWTSEFRIEFERLRIKYTAHENGRFSRNAEVIFNRMPTEEELLA